MSDWTRKYNSLLFTRHGRVLTITLDNPPLNPMTSGMHKELSTVFADAEADPESDVVVLTGSGTAFSAGGNVKAMLAQLDSKAYHRSVADETPRIVRSMLAMSKPMIARVNGHAIGIGATLALYCDVIIAVENAKIADMHVNIGLSAGDGGALIWPQLIGFARAKYYLLTGDAIGAREAADIGLITKAVATDVLDAEVYDLAERLANGAQLAIRATKRSINMQFGGRSEALLDAHVCLELSTMFSEDYGEALRALDEKRAPQFGGN